MTPLFNYAVWGLVAIALCGCQNDSYVDRFGTAMHPKSGILASEFAKQSTPETAVDDLLAASSASRYSPIGSRNSVARLNATSLMDRFPDFADRVGRRAFGSEDPPHVRITLISVLSVLGANAEPWVPRLADLAYAEDDAQDSLRNSAASALGGIGREVPRVVDQAIAYFESGNAKQMSAALIVIETAGSKSAHVSPIVVRRIESAASVRETESLLQTLALVDKSQLTSSRVVNAAMPRLRTTVATAIATGKVDGETPIYLAWMRKLGSPPKESVPLIVRMLAESGKREPGGGWATLGGIELIRPYGQKAKPILRDLTKDKDPVVRDVAAFLLETPPVGSD